jgi:hypothetical protein
MAEKTQNKTETKQTGMKMEVVATKNDLMLAKIYAQEDGDFLYTIVLNYKGKYYFLGLGLSIVEAFRNAIKRMEESNMMGMAERINDLERAYRGQRIK